MTTIVCFGDSNTHGMDPVSGERIPREVRWPGVLREQLGPGHEVIEEGLNGRTTVLDDPASPGRAGAAYLGPCLWSHAPVDVVVIMLGTNDLKTRFGCDAPTIADGAGHLVALARRSLAGPGETPPGVLLVAPPPLGVVTEHSELWGFGTGVETSRQLARLYSLVARDAGCAFLDAGRHCAVSPDDGVHLDAAAHRRLGEAVAEAIRPLLDGAAR